MNSITVLNRYHTELTKIIQLIQKQSPPPFQLIEEAFQTLQKYRNELTSATAKAKALVGQERQALQSATLQHKNQFQTFSSQLQQYQPQFQIPQQNLSMETLALDARTHLDIGATQAKISAQELDRQNIQLTGIQLVAENVRTGFQKGGKLADIISCDERKHYIAQICCSCASIFALIVVAILKMAIKK
ncbi:hypothetical protein SS50377_25621 [Spironucleus salmonicida]|uniref:Uncharacterized protein n=1 Tax=Spironucleus salmonicida TaxID=348837 RepID=V6LYX8_9EUKA|nr:hypothetical protein SS50377_25621 [Spironucleus salmonicida]|eukprot:EST49478.1 Hypothetical protein SS50377_10227 [Spironucleus salmonicida]